MVVVILSTMETVDIGNHLVLLLARRANRRMSMTMLLLLLIMLLRITLVLIAAAVAAAMAPCVWNHHASVHLRPDVCDGWATLLSRASEKWHKMCFFKIRCRCWQYQVELLR